MKAIVVRRHGGQRCSNCETSRIPRPEATKRSLRSPRVGLNFLDVYHRTGSFPLETPFIPGSEACGTVVEVGDKTSKDFIGRRVAFVTYPALQGTYAERVRVKAWRLVPIGEALDDASAASALMAGLTRTTWRTISGLSARATELSYTPPPGVLAHCSCNCSRRKVYR